MDKVKNIQSEFAWVLFLQILENFQVLYVKSIKSKEGNSVLAWDLQFIEITVSLFNLIYCFTMILSHFGDVTSRCVTQITVEPLHNGHVMGAEESGRCGKVAVMGRLGCYMTIFLGSRVNSL